jgi:alanine racemase
MHSEGTVTWAEIDLDAIETNLRSFQQFVGPQVEIIAVVKANAYGHGAVQAARTAVQAGVTRLAVARLAEGIQLRRAGLTAPILVLGYTPPDGAGLIAEHNLTPCPISAEFVQALSARAVALGRVIPVHLKVDSGLSRFGLLPEEILPFAQALIQLPGLHFEGLFTHFATADALDPSYALRQLDIFNAVLGGLKAAGIEVPLIHAGNTGITMRYPQAHFNAIRPGIGIYGLSPSDEYPPAFNLRPALTLKTHLSRIRRLPAGTSISYGRTYITPEEMPVGLASIGYGDGLHRLLSNRGAVLVRGKRAPILGRVAMDNIILDLRGIPEARMNDEVVVIGSQGQERISAEEVAGLTGTINYEVTTSLLPRVERVYLRGGSVVAVESL